MSEKVSQLAVDTQAFYSNSDERDEVWVVATLAKYTRQTAEATNGNSSTYPQMRGGADGWDADQES